ncbi:MULTISPECIES: hypothetical protein [Paenibacillus]|uniref:hypothetical protein n=1 Tax=Paenibacillus TaxID=44249 RepID=UPI000385E0AA|nr:MULTISPECIES: hypothetical protein [Paenibacillus]EPY12832.1 hypothetical protein PAAL66ix_10611 [Paenibacillus alvei A6-6i-x]SDF45419.1 hypothetical protein SAMN04488689_10544 [Paenibacillus sp. cl6col]
MLERKEYETAIEVFQKAADAQDTGLLLDIRKTPIIVAVEVFAFSTVHYNGSISFLEDGSLNPYN